jgi:hypothetical protein
MDSTLIARMLDDAYPPTHELGDWRTVLTRAGEYENPRGARRFLARRRAMAFALAAIVVVGIPLAAVAASSDWWFLSDASAPKPTSDVVVVREGQWAGIPWSLTAYRSAGDKLCVALTPNGPDARPTTAGAGRTAAMACNTRPGQPNDERVIHFVASNDAAASDAFPDFIAGVTTSAVVSVTVTGSDGHTLSTDTFSGPDGLGNDVRFFVAPLPAGDLLVAVSALDSSGQQIARISVPHLSSPTGTKTGPVKHGGVDWGG